MPTIGHHIQGLGSQIVACIQEPFEASDRTALIGRKSGRGRMLDEVDTQRPLCVIEIPLVEDLIDETATTLLQLVRGLVHIGLATAPS
jgi:hypothetical protein